MAETVKHIVQANVNYPEPLTGKYVQRTNPDRYD